MSGESSKKTRIGKIKGETLIKILNKNGKG